MDKILEMLPVALTILGALVTVLAVIAPLTKSDLDNRALDVLRKLVDALARLMGASVAPKAK